MHLPKFGRQVIIVAILYNCLIQVDCLDDPSLPNIFYPFGTDVGDSIAPVNDDGYTNPVPISIGFPFFSTTRNVLFVNTNGAVSFGQGVSAFTPQPFPLPGLTLVCPYWCDVDTRRNNGRAYYRESTDPALLARASVDIQAAFAGQGLSFFYAQWLFIATWHNVTYYGGNSNSSYQSFQAILVTNGINSFSIFNYGTMTWTTGSASGGINGLNGTSAQVGFNAGDGINFYAIQWSRTPEVINVGAASNVGVRGRWIFRIDNSNIEAPGCDSSENNGTCRAYQVVDSDGTCQDVAPSFSCPTIQGPTVINRLWIEFYCSVASNVSDSGARYDVVFLFDGRAYSDVPVFTISGVNPRATLHERYLSGKLGKWITCNVTSYWSGSASRSRPVTSSGYWAGIQASTYLLSVDESYPTPTNLLLKSTLPITCDQRRSSGNLFSCRLSVDIYSTQEIAVRQRLLSSVERCAYTFNEEDWRSNESLAYNNNSPLEVLAKVDRYVTSPRLSYLNFSFPTNRLKTVNGQTYTNMWSGYVLPLVSVYRYDHSGSVCSSSGDPRIITFDGYAYSAYATGQFIYTRTLFGLPTEVQVRHWPCAQSVVSCVCGVAMREDRAILAVDMCTDGRLHFLTYNANNLPDGAGITQMPSGHSYKIQMPSGNKVTLDVFSWGMNIHIYVNAFSQTEGLCGTFDGNPNNDLIAQGSSSPGQSVETVVNSWRIPFGRSLFDGYIIFRPQPIPPIYTRESYCQCSSNLPSAVNNALVIVDTQVCGGSAVSDGLSLPWEPNQPVVVSDQQQRTGRTKRSTDSGSRIDNIDETYDSSSFRYNSNPVVNSSWPTPSGITQEQATLECRSRLLNQTVLGSTCYEIMYNNSITEDIVQKCVADVQLTEDFVTWSADKVPEMQKACIDRIVSANYSGENDTSPQEVIDLVRNSVIITSGNFCQPADCSGHGSCIDGTCVCDAAYIGSDCAVARSAVPTIVRLMETEDCDIRRKTCRSINLQTTNVADTPTSRTRVHVQFGYGVNARTNSDVTILRKTSFNTANSQLPSEPLSGFRINVNVNQSEAFENLPQGNPAVIYRISLSNDGGQFGNEMKMRVIDPVCMECDSSTCSAKMDACEINGYCFASNEANPFNSTQTCQPSKSRNSWSSVTDDADHSSSSKSSSPDVLVTTFILTVFGVVHLL